MALHRYVRSVAALVVVLFAASGCSSGGGTAAGTRSPFARAFQVTDRNQLIGGATATAAVGDFMLENDQIRLAVVGAFESAGPNLYGGGLVDADLQRPDAKPADGRDELGEIFPVIDIRVQRPDEPEQLTGSTQPIASSVKVLAAGGDGAGQQAIVRVEAALVPYLAITDLIPLDLQTSDVRIVHDYILEPGKRYLTIRTEVRYGAEAKTEFVPRRSFTVTYSPGPLQVLVPILLGQTFGDIALFGGKTDLFSPAFGFDAFSAQLQPAANPTPDRYWNEAAPFRNTFENPLTGPFFAGVGKRISYGLTTPRGTLTIPLLAGDVAPQFYASSLDVRDAAGRSPSPAAGQPGDAITYERYFIVGEGDVASVLDVVNEVRGLGTGVLAGRVIEEATSTALSGARVLVFDHPRDARGDLRDLATLDWRDLGFPASQFQTDVRLADGIPDGSFEGTIVPGHYVLLGVSSGRGRSPLVPVEVVAGQRTPASVVVPRSGKVRVEVRDAGRAGAGLPAKITITELDGHGVPWPRFGEGSLPLSRLPRDGAIYEPQTADAARADLEFVAAYRYTTDGRAVFELEPGRYRVHASRGYEYSIDQRDVTAEAGLEKLVVLTIARAVESTGWITADFHVHSESSHDASCPKVDRVKGHAAQGMDLLAATDHDYITNYWPYIDQLNLRPWISTLVGDELTTVEAGHYNGFPAHQDQSKAANGAPRWLGLAPPQIFETLRSLGKYGPDRTVTVANHPRSSSTGYFSQFGFDQGTGVLCSDNFITLGNPIVRSSFFGPVKKENFCIDCFVAMEAVNGKRLEQIRTPTIEEVPPVAPGQTEPLPPPTLYRVLERTADEQRRLLASGDLLALDDSGSNQGGVDDFFAVLNLGASPTALANSDSHGCGDSGKGASWVELGTDVPGAIDEIDVAKTVAAGHVALGFGPLVRFRIGDARIGDTVTRSDGIVDLDVDVQGPDWFQIDRVEVYANGELVAERSVPRPNPATYKFRDRITVDVRDAAVNDHRARDTYFVVVALGDDDLFPVNFPTVEPSGDPLSDAFSSIVPSLFLSNGLPRTFNIPPYALTNPIFVDVDGDGRFTAPGRPPANGRFKLAQCEGASRPEDCACESLELPPDDLLGGALAVKDFVQWQLALDQIHGRQGASPPPSIESRRFP